MKERKQKDYFDIFVQIFIAIVLVLLTILLMTTILLLLEWYHVIVVANPDILAQIWGASLLVTTATAIIGLIVCTF